ncbi:MAG: glycosyltransferase family 2 protein [Kiritimatiellae bacterium]|nr:glycosyltransferase family 2 protein [Kiritimatiellia bacterium]MCO5060713.1 glycosyltransferase family 2 protein [Kiritimatiellia bacterium]MCO6399926.1 glycosyltransferase family 2 protein [Verrucomicrobiota bacterium]
MTHIPSTSNPCVADVELSVVVPVYKEEATIPDFLARITPILRGITEAYEILFVLDPSPDRTEEVIQAAIANDPRIRLLVMTRRWGQPACTMAGIELCHGRACVVIDVDLQDPPELIVELVAKWREGYDVVLAQRRSREGETLPKRLVSWVGYWVINRISEAPIPRNSGDFRLMDRKVIEALRELKETHGFLRGLVGYVGYRQTIVQYDRAPRAAGQSKYSQITGSLRIGFNGIVAFSSKPLTLATVMGFGVALASVLLGLGYVGVRIFTHKGMIAGLAPLILIITFLGGVQLICLGIMGEYIGRIYEEVRQRPKYRVARRVNFEEVS